MSDRILKIEHLSKIFSMGGGLKSKKITAVNDVNFTIGANGPELFALAGESGSGKSTLAKIILNMEKATKGTITYRDRELTSKKAVNRKWFLQEIQPIFQNPFETFSPLRKVENYLRETAENLCENKSQKENDIWIDEVLEMVGLTRKEISDKYPNEFSGGQLQRVSIARALISSPTLLVADEPVSMVDASMRMSIVNLFKELKDQKNLSILYITHDLATAYYAADRIAVMLRGEIIEIGEIEAVLKDPYHPYTRILLESLPEPDPDKKWHSDKSLLALFEEEEYRMTGCKFSGRCPNVMPKCRTEAPGEYAQGTRMTRCFLYE